MPPTDSTVPDPASTGRASMPPALPSNRTDRPLDGTDRPLDGTDRPLDGTDRPSAQPVHPPQSPATTSRHIVAAPDGQRLSVLVAVPGEGIAPAAGLPVVVALHGYASSAAGGWGRTGHLDSLTRAGRTVLAPDLRGHGESAKPHAAQDYSLDTVLADIAAVVDQIPRLAALAAPWMTSFGAVDLIGYSLGARLGWSALSRGTVPIRRMVLGGFDGRRLFDGVESGRLEKLAASAPGNDLVALAALVEGLVGTGGVQESEARVGIPVLIVAGDRDPLATGAKEFAARLPHGEFLAILNRNHISAVPARAYRERLVAFLA